MWRHARAIALLPGTVTIVVPALILLLGAGANFAPALVLVGAGLIAAGFALWVWTVRLFARLGRGTLAPWDRPSASWSPGPTATCATR